jgi:hypothetical protein
VLSGHRQDKEVAAVDTLAAASKRSAAERLTVITSRDAAELAG